MLTLKSGQTKVDPGGWPYLLVTEDNRWAFCCKKMHQVATYCLDEGIEGVMVETAPGEFHELTVDMMEDFGR